MIAGLLVGDEIEAADSRPFAPILAFKGKAGKKVSLRVRRRLDVKPFELAITPRWARPQAESEDALRKSVRVISTPHHRIGYVRVWSWAGEEMEAAVVWSESRPPVPCWLEGLFA
jgi:carboxyl-terminal processing protease